MPSKEYIEEQMQLLARRLNYKMRDVSHLSRAMYCKKQRGYDNYQNDEMATLGDAVLGLIFAEHFYRMGLDKDEITRRKAEQVSNATLKALCDTLGVHQFAYNDRYFADEAPPHARLPYKDHDFYMEAIIAAVYMDRGLAYTRTWLLALWRRHVKNAP